MKTLIFKFEKPFPAKAVYATGLYKIEYIELIGMFETGCACHSGFKCPEDRVREAIDFFKEHKINIIKEEEIPTDTPKHIHVKLEKPLDCVLLKFLPPIPLKASEYRQIEGKEFLEAFKCIEEEFVPVKIAFDEIGIVYKVY